MVEVEKVDWNTDYGKLSLDLNKVMDNKHITVSIMSRLSGIKYDVVKNYYNDRIHIYNANILAKFCYVLKCNISDIVVYKFNEENK